MRGIDTLGYSHDGLGGEPVAHIQTFVDGSVRSGWQEVESPLTDNYERYIGALSVEEALQEYLTLLDGIATVADTMDDLGPRVRAKMLIEKASLEEKRAAFKGLGKIPILEEVMVAKNRRHIGYGL